MVFLYFSKDIFLAILLGFKLSWIVLLVLVLVGLDFVLWKYVQLIAFYFEAQGNSHYRLVPGMKVENNISLMKRDFFKILFRRKIISFSLISW